MLILHLVARVDPSKNGNGVLVQNWKEQGILKKRGGIGKKKNGATYRHYEIILDQGLHCEREEREETEEEEEEQQ